MHISCNCDSCPTFINHRHSPKSASCSANDEAGCQGMSQEPLESMRELLNSRSFDFAKWVFNPATCRRTHLVVTKILDDGPVVGCLRSQSLVVHDIAADTSGLFVCFCIANEASSNSVCYLSSLLSAYYGILWHKIRVLSKSQEELSSRLSFLRFVELS